MTIIAALLVCLAIKVTRAAETDCRNISCPCGSTGENVTLCVSETSVYEDICTRLSKCASCEEGSDVCSSCPEGLEGSNCSQATSKIRQKRQNRYPMRFRPRPRVASPLSCQNLESPKLGSLRCMSSSERQTCTGKCLPGYRFTSGNEDEITLTCRGGKWTPRTSFPECKSGGHCDLIVEGSGSFNCTTGMEGTRCDVQCSGRYEGRFFCYPGREWQPALPRCVKPKFNTESRQTCPCRNGGTCDNNGICVCLNGWTGTHCETVIPRKASCRDPGFLSNGFRRNPDGSEAKIRRNFEEGQSLVYGCTSDEYVLKGSSLISCRQDGTWSSPVPSCIRPPTAAPVVLVCPDPGQKANANRLNTDGTPSIGSRRAGTPEYPVGHSVVYTCHQGYALEGQSLLTCLASGKWSSRTPYCRLIPPPSPVINTTPKASTEEVFCRDPRVDVNGLRKPKTPPDRRGFPPGTALEYSCERGYDLVGERTLFCLTEGLWSANRPRCVPQKPTSSRPYCKYPGDILNGQTVHFPSLDVRKRPSEDQEEEYPEGSRLRYSCDDGYIMQGLATLVCQSSGSWTTTPPSCVLGYLEVCLNPGPISNGVASYYVGPSQPVPADEPEYQVGSILRYTCLNGYSLVGNADLVCEESGRWSAATPSCRRNNLSTFCRHPGTVANARVVHIPPANERSRPTDDVGEEYPAESQLRYSCNFGYTLIGADILYCQNTGSWTASPPVCMNDNPVPCEHPGYVLNGRLKYYPPGINLRSLPEANPDYDLDEFPEESIVEFSCDEGYLLQGNKTLTCVYGVWSGKTPTCEPDCGRSFMHQAVYRISNGTKTIAGDWPWVVSISGETNGSSSFICGGAVLNPHTIVTAAHCLTRHSSFILRFGKHQFENSDDDAEVLIRRSTRVIIHPAYLPDQSSGLDSDIGLIIFKPRIRYSIRLQPICLPEIKTTLVNIKPGRQGYIGGWGMNENDNHPEIMMLARLPVVSNKECMEAYPQLALTSNMFCAGYEDNRQSVCEGDSGSPLVFYDKSKQRYVLEGLVSFGTRGECGVAGKYAIFTKVFEFVLWIMENYSRNKQ